MDQTDRDVIQVLGIAGSLREGSYNRALLRAAAEIARELEAGAPEEGDAPPTPRVEVEIFPLDDIPLFNQDVEDEGYPAPVKALHDAVAYADALLISTPEYQFGVPGVLKNAIDWASRPPGKATILGKPVAIMGATSGMWGTARAQTQLRQVLVYNRCPMVLQPEVLVAKAGDRFDDGGRLTHEATRGFVQKLLEALRELTLRSGPSGG